MWKMSTFKALSFSTAKAIDWGCDEKKVHFAGLPRRGNSKRKGSLKPRGPFVLVHGETFLTFLSAICDVFSKFFLLPRMPAFKYHFGQSNSEIEEKKMLKIEFFFFKISFKINFLNIRQTGNLIIKIL